MVASNAGPYLRRGLRSAGLAWLALAVAPGVAAAASPWTSSGSLGTPRVAHAATVLPGRQDAGHRRERSGRRPERRRALRRGVRKLGGRGRDGHEALCPHGDAAPERQGARRRGANAGAPGPMCSRAPSSTTRSTTSGRRPGASTGRGSATPRRCWRTARCSFSAATATTASSSPRSSTTQPATPGPPRGTCRRCDFSTRRRGWPTARCSSRRDGLLRDAREHRALRPRRATRGRPGRAWRTAASAHTATALADGRVLLVGGDDESGGHTAGANLSSAELYDPAAGTWSPAASATVARAQHDATLLPNGNVLVTSGARRRRG